jgi:hypothetical protein
MTIQKKNGDFQILGMTFRSIGKILGTFLIIIAGIVLFSKLFFTSYAGEVGLTSISKHDSLACRVTKLEGKVEETSLDSEVMSRNAVIINARSAYFRDSLITRFEYDSYISSLSNRETPAREILKKLNDKYLAFGRK